MPKRLQPRSKLDTFVQRHRLTYANIAREAGVSRQHLLRIRRGASPTIGLAKRIRLACGRLIKRSVRITEVFDV